MNTKTKKITLATVKSFIKKNIDNIYIEVSSKFDGMYDCCMYQNDGFVKAEKEDVSNIHTFGIKDAWFVLHGGDYFKPFESENMIGIEVSNCCGYFTLAIKK